MTRLLHHVRLARDALTARHMGGHGCFVWNRSCALLEEIGEPALPSIEAVVIADVLPFYFCSLESLERKFPGLPSLLVTYFAVGKDTGADRICPFFRRLYGSVRVEAMLAVNVAWLQRTPTGPVPESLMTTVRRLAEEGSGQVRELARWLVERAEEYAARSIG